MRELLRLLAVKTNNSLLIALLNAISDEELLVKQLGKDTMQSLGLKGSPKLSKQLISIGLNADLVSQIMNWATSTTSSILFEGDVILEQGDSVHYKSCQAIDPRSAGRYSVNFNRVQEDLVHFGTSLFLWVMGEPMSINGTGFKSRAKLRTLVKGGKVAGLFVDQIYGNAAALMTDIPTLQTWWDNYSVQKG